MNAERVMKHETRLCKVNGKYGIFHLWEEQYTRPITDGLSFISTGIGSQVFGIVEFADCVKRVQPDEIVFCDEQSDYLAQLNEIMVVLRKEKQNVETRANFMGGKS